MPGIDGFLHRPLLPLLAVWDRKGWGTYAAGYHRPHLMTFILLSNLTE